MIRVGILLSIALAALVDPATPARGAVTIFRSGLLNHAVPRTFDGTSLNLVTVAFDDTGPLSGDWDINFWSQSGALAIDPLDDYAVRVVVDDNGEAAVLQRGDRIGPDSTLAHVADLSPEWLAGVDGYLGVEFVCAGRLADPPNDQVCYGYIHIASSDASGFPATIVNYAFDVAGFAIFIDDEPTCWIKGETIFCDGFNAVGMRQ
jgi:hypothetical protein